MNLHKTEMTSLAFVALVALFAASGCVERKMVITSDPPGASVTINQTWSGKTPYVLPFKHYGTYDIRVEKADHYPLHVAEPITAPLYQKPGLDFASEVLLPKKVRDVRRLHYKLEKTTKQDKLEDILVRANEMAERTRNVAETRKARDAMRRPRKLPLREKKSDDDKPETEEPAPEETTVPKTDAVDPGLE